MSSILGYINLLLVLIQPAPASQEPVLEKQAAISSLVEWVFTAPEPASLMQLAAAPQGLEAVTNNNKALPVSGEVELIRYPSNLSGMGVALRNKARHSIKLFILYCQLKSDLLEILSRN
ncbi:MAG: hypothetical protein WCO43_03760 [Chitinophagia bacterium]